MNFLSESIHRPGLGKITKAFGKTAVNKKGVESPSPTKKKIKKIIQLLDVKAKVSAVPRKGAEQGVDRIVARIPLKKSPVKLSFN